VPPFHQKYIGDWHPVKRGASSKGENVIILEPAFYNEASEKDNYHDEAVEKNG
jgi:hypothetical protein